MLYQDKLIDIEILRNKMNEFESLISKMKINIEGIINKLKNIIEKMNSIYIINNNILTNYEKYKKRNYKSLLNLNYMNDYIEKEMNIIKDKYNYGYNINQLLNIENIKITEDKISNKNNQNNIQTNKTNLINQNAINNNQIIYQDINNNNSQNNNDINNIENQNNNQQFQKELNNNDYIIYKPKNEGNVRIFGANFVNNNKKKCKIIYKNKEFELKEYFNDINKKYNNKDEIKIKLKGINNITNMSHMFESCSTLSSLPDILKWDTSKVTSMSGMFSSCYNLFSLPDISKWDTSKVTSMGYMFSNCSVLSSLPDISKWDTSKVTNMSYMFSNCKKSLNIPSKFKK